jgi:glycosyltransferase involved in cell wall biosynthesis
LRVADVPDNRTGGMSRAMYCTGDIMRRLGHHVDYAFTEQLGPTGWRPLRRFIRPRRITRLVTQWQQSRGPYDVVEVHEPSAGAYAAARRLRRPLPPLVVFSHGIVARGHHAMLAYRQHTGRPASWKQWLSSLIDVWLANFALCRADHVLCLNTEDARFVCALRGGEAGISCLSNGVDDSFLTQGASRTWAPELARRLLFIGTWIERKGIIELATATTCVLDEFPDSRLTIAGCHADPTRVRARFPERLHPRIEVIPRITEDQGLADIYCRHGILVLPSYFEGQPLVMLEAAAMGLAIVSTDVCGMHDFVVPGRHGWLVPPGDAKELAAALRRLMAHPEEVLTLGEAARLKAQSYTWENAARATLAAYSRAAGAKRACQSSGRPSGQTDPEAAVEAPCG